MQSLVVEGNTAATITLRQMTGVVSSRLVLSQTTWVEEGKSRALDRALDYCDRPGWPIQFHHHYCCKVVPGDGMSSQ